MSINSWSTRQIIDRLYLDYLNRVPGARKVQELFSSIGENWVEDHFALRSFAFENFGIAPIQGFFSRLGYESICEDYVFPVKKLKAIHMAHPDRTLPKIFISALQVDELSTSSQEIIKKYLHSKKDPLEKMSLDSFDPDSFLYPCWGQVDYQDYLKLRDESEYGAWTLLFGNSLNHFTVAVHHLKNFSSLAQLNQWLKNEGFQLNQDQSEIKGSPEVKLEQSSTMAEAINVEFLNAQVHPIPCAFIEFAFRFLLDGKSGDLWEDRFQGFVEGNADKIFTSTNTLQIPH